MFRIWTTTEVQVERPAVRVLQRDGTVVAGRVSAVYGESVRVEYGREVGRGGLSTTKAGNFTCWSVAYALNNHQALRV